MVAEQVQQLMTMTMVGFPYVSSILPFCFTDRSGSTGRPPDMLRYTTSTATYSQGVSITPNHPSASGYSCSWSYFCPPSSVIFLFRWSYYRLPCFPTSSQRFDFESANWSDNRNPGKCTPIEDLYSGSYQCLWESYCETSIPRGPTKDSNFCLSTRHGWTSL